MTTLQQTIRRRGSKEEDDRLFEDFERMGLSRDSLVDDVIEKVADRNTPWNIRSALLMISSAARIEEVATRLPALVETHLMRDWDFEELHVVESAWWMLLEFAKDLAFEDLLRLGNRTLEKALLSKAGNLENIVSAVTETIVENDLNDGSVSFSYRTEQWLSQIDRKCQAALRSRTVLTEQAEEFHLLATGRSVKPSRRVLSDWLIANVEQIGRGNE